MPPGVYLAPHVARTSARTQCLNLVWSSQARAADLEARNQRLTEDLHRCRAMIADLKAKLAAAEEALAKSNADIEMLKVPLSKEHLMFRPLATSTNVR